MANTSVDGVINALKGEVENQEKLKMIEDHVKGIPVKIGLEAEPKLQSNARFISSYNKEVHNELLRAIQILEQARPEEAKTMAIEKSDPKLKTIIKVMAEQYNIQEMLKAASDRNDYSTEMTFQTKHEYNAMYKRELGEALEYLDTESELI